MPPPPDLLRDHATQFLQRITTPGWAADHNLVSATLQDMAVEWSNYPQDTRANLRSAACQGLEIEPVRFDFLMRAGTVEDFEAALEYQPTTLTLSPDEKAYPAVGGWLGDYLAYASGGEANLAFHFWSGLATIAAASRRQFYYSRGGHSGRALYPNLYVILEGPSGSGKGTAIFRAMDMMERLNQAICDNSRAVPPTVHILPSKLTIQELVQILHTNRRQYRPTEIMQPNDDAYESCGVIVAEEATSLLGKQNVGVDSLIGGLTEMYDGRLSEGTVKRGQFYLNNVSLTMLAGSTMDWLKESLTDDIFRGGFMGARCLMVSRKKTGRRFYREPIADPVQRDHLVRRLVDLSVAPKTRLKLTPDADQWLKAWYEAAPTDVEEADVRLAAFVERLDMHLTKVAMLLAISEGTTPWITRPTLEAAAAILQTESQFMVRALKVVSSGTAIDDMEYVEQVLWDHGGRLQQSLLVNKLRYKLGTRRNILECLGTLMLAGRIERKEVQMRSRCGGGLHRTDWLLKPKEDIDRTVSDDDMETIHQELDDARERLRVADESRERHAKELAAATKDPTRLTLPLGGVGGAKGHNKDPWGGY